MSAKEAWSGVSWRLDRDNWISIGGGEGERGEERGKVKIPYNVKIIMYQNMQLIHSNLWQ